MKLTVGRGRYSDGFALPTILLVATVMLIVLTASIAAAAASRVSLDSQYYNQLAQQAAQSGLNRANECLKSNGYAPQWATSATNRDLRPDSDCSGVTIGAAYASPYVVGTGGSNPSNMRTKYSVEAPSGTAVGSILRIIGTTELVRTSSPNSVWRSYEQSLYLRIEPPKTITCPDGFIAVPGDARFNTNDFCVGKYEAKNVGGKAMSQADGTPWVSISQIDAIAAAMDACSGCRLITESERLTIAHNLINVSSNWSGGSVGDGYIFRGHADNDPASALAASNNDDAGYSGTGQSSGDQYRVMRLNNGERIWDFSGNVWEWSTGEIQGGKPGASGLAYRDWKDVAATVNFTPNPLPSFGTPQASSWTSTSQGIGSLYSNSDDTGLRVFRSGGSFADTTSSGPFALNMSHAPTTTYVRTGFRLVYDPLATSTCPSGQVLVPGNSSFGTKNFCVGKYEAKNVGGIATSQAAGSPWVNISQNDAINTAKSACSTCRLMSNEERLTISHNALNVPSNWSGGSVGSGYMYGGNYDGSPGYGLAASTDDNNGYFGTGNSSGIQRRTLKLNTGEVVWDLSGNVWDWTSGTTTGGQPGASGFAVREWNAINGTGSLSPSPFPSYGTPAASSWGIAQGVGWVYSSTTDAAQRSFIFGGGYNEGSAGLFSLYLGVLPTTAQSNIGFRVTSDPISTISCSSGMIPVPGDSRFGTTDFCVGKYEAKNVGGVATSQADGLPWASLNQAAASAAANAACAKCRLIGEAEWLTIAHNVVNVPSNWSTGTVGSGYIYSGHSDNSPGNAIAASSDDSSGYFNTGNASGNQRRTLTLSNGQVIWDLAGNVYEWTSAQISGAQPGPSGWVWRDWKDVTDTGAFTPNPFPKFATPAASTWTSANGIGRFYSNSSETTLRGYRRGGYWYHDGTSGNSGIFQLALNLAPTDTASALGFRVVEIK